MNPDSRSLEQLLKQSPAIADAGFSDAVVARIARRQRRHQQVLMSVWVVTGVAAMASIVAHLPSWLAFLKPLSTSLTKASEQVALRVSEAPLQILWQSPGTLLVTGLLAVLLAAASAAAWE